MPHKRAKHSARNASRDSLGFDRVPTGKTEMDDIPHSARLLFAGPPAKRRPEPDRQEAETSLKIRPNERMRDFRERVDNTFSADINATIKRGQRSESNSRKRERRRELLKAKKRAANPALAHEDAAADWAKAAEKRSLHDVAQAPPVLTARPKERKKQPSTILEAQAASRPKPSLARQRILDEERDIAVKKYREHKKAKEQHIPSQ
ncbi:hypothetical protein MPSI1_002480 [Malassezia psittaci]|uniref:Uncharacterized protein n=1 Tax=Malassezia psittaci TaxID=1821823 RepID=A0AAF0JEQ8_9BASI|nr:hypothetical protein MPSI1_002480 [Malassezia psittaci]